MQTHYGELCEITALVQKNAGDLVEQTALIAVPTQEKAMLAFMEFNNLHSTQIIKFSVKFVRYVLCAM